MDGGGERAQDTGSRSVYDRQLASVRTPNVSDEVPLDECHCTPLPGAPPPAARPCTPPPYPIRVSSRAECEGRQRVLRGTAQPRRITICREAAPLSLSHHVGQHSPIAPLCGATVTRVSADGFGGCCVRSVAGVDGAEDEYEYSYPCRCSASYVFYEKVSPASKP
jgi:hypothetical protein